MKRIFCLLAIAVLLFVLSACGQSSNDYVAVQPSSTTVPTSSPVIVDVTAIPAAAPTATPAVSPTPMASPTPTLEIVYVTPAPTNVITIVPAPGEKQQQSVPSATAYARIINNYKNALTNGWDAQTCIDNGVNYLVPVYAQNYPNDLGYCFKDVDGNGIEELIIGNGNQMLTMYSLSGSTPVLVFDGGERSSYYLEPDGVIVNSGSSSAFYHVYNLYKLNGTALVLSGSIISNYEANYDNPYYYSSDGDDDVSNDEKVSNETAESWINAYESNYVSLPYTSLI